MWGKIDFKNAVATFAFASILCAIANKPVLLSQVGTVIINLIQNFGRKYKLLIKKGGHFEGCKASNLRSLIQRMKLSTCTAIASKTRA